MELMRFLEKELPLEQRVESIRRSDVSNTGKLESVLLANIGFYEKVGLIYSLFNEDGNRTANYIEHNLMSQMSIGEIISEILKPNLVDLGEEVYPDIDFSIVFSDNRYNLAASFIREIDEEVKFINLWKSLEEASERSIETRYKGGINHFVKVISRMNGSQPFLPSNPKKVFQSTSEYDYVVKLANWAEDRGYLNHGYPEKLEQFLDAANSSYTVGRTRVGKSRVKTDFTPQLKEMDSNHITIIGMEFDAYIQHMPVLLTFRAKSMRSACEKISAAYSALISAHGRGIVEMVLRDFPWKLEEVISKREKQKLPVKNYETDLSLLRDAIEKSTLGSINWQENQTRSTQQRRWESLSYKEKYEKWEALSDEVRQSIVGINGNYGDLISKYTTIEDTIRSADDFFGATLALETAEDWLSHAEGIVNWLFHLPGRSLEVKPSPQVEYINREHYNAVHMDLMAEQGYSSVELHITNVLQLLINDSVGEGCHTLRVKRRTRELLNVAPRSEKMLYELENLLGEKTIQKGETFTEGYLESMKSYFPRYLSLLQRHGIPVDMP